MDSNNILAEVEEQTNIAEANAVLQRLQAGDYSYLKILYKDYRNEFVTWTQRHFNCEAEDAADVFQDTVIAFYKNVTHGKLTELNSSVKTYLFAIGKRLLLKKFRTQSRIQLTDWEADPPVEQLDLGIWHTIEHEHQKKIIQTALQQIGEKCQKLILLFYYHRYSTEAVQRELEYNSEGVVRTQKRRCMQALREVIMEKGKM